jgi:hypothetical protein
MRFPSFSLALTFITVLLATSNGFPHGGGLDGYGCHHNRKLGGYHCHRGEFAGQSFASQEEMLKKRAGGKDTPQNIKRKPAAGE